ncbi:hypothetical protein LTR85_008689 [Meristemomyces frigidus]|nr:hypothetical protein LTR85_008689 [Meristemomyces frigidus]
MRDAAEIADFVRDQEQSLEAMMGESNQLQYEPLRASLTDREAQRAAAKLQRLAGSMAQLRRAMPARHKHREIALRNLYLLAHQVLLVQGLIQPETGEMRPRPPPVTGYNDDPEPPLPLIQADEDKYKKLRGVLYSLREDHDKMADTYTAEWEEHMRDNPGSTRTEFDVEWVRRCRQAARNVRVIEEAFMKIRDMVLQAGGEPVAQDYEGDDIDEFAGRHPEDGTVGCMTTGTKRYLQEKVARDKPGIERWLGAVEDEVAPSESSQVDGIPGGVLSESDGEDEGITQAVRPWDSVSQQERRPRARTRVVDYRRQHCRSR